MQVTATLLALVIAASPARADTDPWAAGVTAERKATAQARLEEGNARFLERDYTGALERYRAAIAAWDHPAIRFNIVRCLIQLDRPVDASDNLALALKFGAAPLAATVYDEALSYQKLLANQIGEIEVACVQSGVAITLDGDSLPRCPARERRRVKPGPHHIVGTADGFATKTIAVDVFGGTHVTEDVTLVPLARASTVVHRWPTWQPWLVFGGGIAVVGVGGAIGLQASADMSTYDREVARECAVTGCTPSQLDNRLRSRAKLENGIAIGVASTGLAAAVVGGVLLYMNRGRTVYEDARVGVVPNAGGAVVTLSFQLGR